MEAKEPIRPYLVQRAKFYDNPSSKGIDGILRFDYMGSSEFEMGDLPRSLRRIRAAIGEFGYFPLEINEHEFVVFCKEADKELVFEAIRGLGERKFHLKEYCDLHNLVTNDTFLPCRNDMWWDIVNDFMVWKQNDEFTEKFRTAILPA